MAKLEIGKLDGLMGDTQSNQIIKRVASLWFPTFSTDRVTRLQNRQAKYQKSLYHCQDKQIATVDMWQQDSLIKAVSNKAKKLGVQPGMTTSTAKTIIADLKIVPSDPEDDRKFLNLILEWCYNYTARVSVDQSRHYLPGDGSLWLDFTGTAHLFGGEKKTLTDLSARLTNSGLNHYISLADTPGAAWAAARFIQNNLKRVFIWKPGEQKTLLPILPVEALRLSDQIIKDLNSLGLYKIKDLQRNFSSS